MAFSVIVSGLSAISSALKITEYIESHGLPLDTTIGGSGPDGEILTLNLGNGQKIGGPSPADEIQNAALKIQSSVGDALDDLFKGTSDRVAKCLRDLNDAANDPDVLPPQRKRFGIATRKCICAEIQTIRDAVPGQIPKELEEMWTKHACDKVA